jgi:hypothetical protein
MTLALSNTAFWDTDMTKMDEKAHAPFIITRVFQYGLVDDIRQVIRAYTPYEIKDVFRRQRGIDPKAVALASVALGIDEQQLKYAGYQTMT